MANTRDIKSLGVWAEDAVTPVDPFPQPGTSYRDETVTDAENKIGEPFDTKPDSAVFNQKMFIVTSFIDLIDKHGVVGWSDLVDYVVPAIVWGSDSKFYFALQSSGPSSATKDPISEPTYWELVTSATQLRQDLESQVPGDEGSRLVGYNKFDINGGLDEGLTVKSALDELVQTTAPLRKMKLAMSGSFDGTTGAAIGSTFNVYQNKAFKENTGFANIPSFTVLFDEDDLSIFGASNERQFLYFVSTRAIQDPNLPAGNLIPSVQSVNPQKFLVPPSFTETKPGVVITQYEIQTNVQLELDFDLIVIAVDPVSVSQFP